MFLPAGPSTGREQEIRRTARILDLIQRIAVRPHQWKRNALAADFEISERQVQKDLDIVRHRLRLPLQHDRQGYYFTRIPQLPAVTYSFSEALALLLAVQSARQVSGIASAELAAAVARLETLFSPEFIPLFRQMLSPPVITAQREHRQQMLLLLHRSLLEKRKVRMVYETRSRGGEAGERVVHPYHVMPYVRSWQMVAHCEKRGEVLIFKVDRIREAALLEDRYVIPKDFDLNAYLGDAWGLMRGEAGQAEDVLLRFEADTGHRVAEEYWHASQQAEEQPDGSMLFKLHIAATSEFVNWLLYYGARVNVLAPPWLRERVAAEHRQAAGVYGGGEGTREE